MSAHARPPEGRAPPSGRASRSDGGYTVNAQIALILGQDGVANGAVYALLALCILLVFSVTRVLLIPQGEFVVYGALCMAAMQNGRMPIAGLAAGRLRRGRGHRQCGRAPP